MVRTVVVNALNLFGNEVLSGKIAARRDFARACEAVAGGKAGTTVEIDFSGVKYVSGSWINWMIVPFVGFAADDLNDYYLVISNFPEDSLDDLHLIANAEHVPFLVRQGEGEIVIIGDLDPGQLATLKAVKKEKEATGAMLADATVKATAWNNRLRDLNLKRLLRRRKAGREQFYSLTEPEVQIHG